MNPFFHNFPPQRRLTMPNGHINGCPTERGGVCTCADESRRYRILAVLSLFVCISEGVGGIFFGSLALLADAGHTSIDAIENIVLARVSHLARFTEDEHRIRRLGGKISAALLLIVIALFLFEAISHLGEHHPLSVLAVWVAIAALAVNIVQYWIHNKAPDEHRNLSHWWQNTHLLTDIVGSVAAIIGTALSVAGIPYADFAAALAIIVLVTYRFLKGHEKEDGHRPKNHHH